MITPLSHSRITLGNLCLYAFNEKYNKGDDKPAIITADVLIRGQVFHEIVAAANQKCIDAGEQVIMDNASSIAPDYASKLTDEYYEDILQLCEKWDGYHLIENPKHAKAEVKIALDSEWQPCDYEDENAFVRGRLDLFSIDGNVAHLVDYKTNWRPMLESEVLQSYQLGIYALLVMQTYPEVTMIKGAMDFIRVPLRHERIIMRDELPAIRHRLKADYKRLNAVKEWEATPNSRCGDCIFVGKCPEFKALENPVQIVKNKTQANKLAKELLGLEGYVSTIKKSLKTWAENHKPIKIGDRVLGYTTKETEGWKVEDVVKQLFGLNLTAEQFAKLVTMNKTKVYSGLKSLDNDEVRAIFDDNPSNSHRTTFGFTKPIELK